MEEKKMREFAVDFLRKKGLYFNFKLEGDNFNSNLIDLLRGYDKEKKVFQEEKKMKYITRDKDYTGCDAEIAELLKQGKEIKGVFSDSCGTKTLKYKGYLAGYRAGRDRPYIIDDGDKFPNFTPTPAKQSTTCVRTLIENGVDIPVDTKVVWNLGGDKLNCYFAGIKRGLTYVYQGDCTSFSNGKEPINANCIYLLEPIEYTPKEI